MKKLAFLIRAILIDHPFSDGNKRTASFVLLGFAYENKLQLKSDKEVQKIIQGIAKENISKIDLIVRRLRNALA